MTKREFIYWLIITAAATSVLAVVAYLLWSFFSFISLIILLVAWGLGW